MRRVLLAALGAATVVASIAGYLASPAGATGLADLSIGIVSSPSAVSPPGGIVVYKVTASNAGPGPAVVNIHDTTTAGTFDSTDSRLAAGCTRTGTTIDCNDVLLLPNSTLTSKVAIVTPSTAGSITNSATIAVSPLDPNGTVDPNTTNNSTSVTTSVSNSTTESGSLVQPGGTLTYQQSVLTNTGSTSVIVGMSTAPAGQTCGTGTCNAGLHVEFDQDPDYAGHVQIDVSFGGADPCKGYGAPKCSSMYVGKDGVTSPIQACPATDPNLPCLDNTYKVGSAFHWVVEMDSNDPDLLPFKL